MPDPELDIVRFTANLARRAFEPVWTLWKLENGHDDPAYPASYGTCIPTAFALRDSLLVITPEFRWKVAGGRPTKRTPTGGYLDAQGIPRPHLWVEGRRAGERVAVDVTADQFGGPPVIVATGRALDAFTANAGRPILRRYEVHEERTIQRLISALDFEFRTSIERAAQEPELVAS